MKKALLVGVLAFGAVIGSLSYTVHQHADFVGPSPFGVHMVADFVGPSPFVVKNV